MHLTHSSILFDASGSIFAVSNTEDMQWIIMNIKGKRSIYLVKLENNVYRIKELSPFPNKPWFLRVCRTSLLKPLWEKEKLLVTSNFSFSYSVLYLFGELSAIVIKSKIVVCIVFQFGRV